MEKRIQVFSKIQNISYILIAISFLWLSAFYVRNFAFAKSEEARAEKETIQNQIFQDYLLLEEPKISYDLISDDSTKKYLSAETPFQDKNYKPVDLFPIRSDFTSNDSTRFSLREEAGIRFSDLAWNFWNENDWAKLQIVSAYRSNGFQNMLLKNWCSRQRCALAGTSEHQAGLALDLQVSKNWRTYALQSGSIYFEWLRNNAYRFWFHNTYQRWIDIDGQMVEPRHWRYLGTWLAKILYENSQTLAEYYNSIEN
jgi:LAS superfamily LD-carboxypeptidase LdcB